MIYYDVEFRLDNEDNDCEYSDELKTLSNAKRFVKELVKQYGNRLVSACIKKWDDELIDAWDYDVSTGKYIN